MNTLGRNFGLDIVGSVAIILVLICHAGPSTYLSYKFGFYGVELFFVLSGFLIGQILLRELMLDNSYITLTKFWIRRWLRTLPLYYIVLIILSAFDIGHEFRWRHFLFIQNFSIDQLTWFGVSWSLSIEEWFYLLIPLVFFVMPRSVSSNKGWFTIFLLAVIGLIIFFRLLYVVKLNPEYDNELRKFIPFRLDSLLVGVMLANINLHFNAIYRVIASRWSFLFMLTTFFLCNTVLSNTIVYDFTNEKTFAGGLGFTLTSVIFMFFIAFLANSNHVMRISMVRPLRLIFYYTSLFSYSIYLIHHELYSMIIHSQVGSGRWFIEIVIALVAIYFIAAVLYYFIERPVLRFRDKLFV